MPQELRQVNGRWEVVGELTSGDLLPFVKPPSAPGGGGRGRRDRPRPALKKIGERAVLNGRPVVWAGDRYGWQSDASYQKLSMGLALLPDMIGAGAINLRRRLERDPAGTANRLLNPFFGARQGLLGVAGAADNVARFGESMRQRHVEKRPQADLSTGAGPLLDQAIDTVYRGLGATPPSQMSPSQRQRDQLNRSVTLNATVGLIPGAGLGVAGAQTVAGMAVRGGSAWALNEVVTNYLDDNTGGHVGHMLETLTGVKTPFNFQPGTADMVDAGNAALLPNMAASAALGGLAGAGAGLLRNTGRRLRSGRAASERERARAELDSDGLTQSAPDGRRAIAPPDPAADWAGRDFSAWEGRQAAAAPTAPDAPTLAPEPAPPASAAPAPPTPSAPSREMEIGGPVQPGELPTAADPSVDPWEIEYDPSLPELDTLKLQLEELDDSELIQALQGPEPVVESVNALLETRPAIEIDPMLRTDLVAMPQDRLSEMFMNGAGELEPWRQRIDALNADQLRALAHPDNSPELFERIQRLGGGEWEELTKRDILDGLRAMADEGGVVVMPDRLTSQPWALTDELRVDPARFQYKGNTNDAGEQVGASLSGASRWDPSSEGVIDVWRDPADEQIYVVNGHNRAGLARRLGVPSVPVKEIVASTPESARAIGAIANINSGAGNAFDAAKFIRDSGIQTPADLVRAGLQINSGHARQGLALSKLPDDVFSAAVNEQITLDQAAMIGMSGRPPEMMRTAYRYLVRSPEPKSVPLDRLREALAIQGPAARPGEIANPNDGGPTLLTGTRWEYEFDVLAERKIDVAVEVRKLLADDRRVFRGASRNAEQLSKVGSIDAAAAAGVGDEASRALKIFDQEKYTAGPVGDLITEAAARVANGEQPKAVAAEVKNRLAAAIREAMGKEAGPAEDVVQVDLMAQAPPSAAAAEAAPAPRLTAAERRAAQNQALRRAIDAEEVRPPETPIPQLPEPPREPGAAIPPAGEALAPGSREAQALADEMRLAGEYARADAMDGWDQEQLLRDAYGYEGRTFEEKKQLGMVEGWDPDAPDAATDLNTAPRGWDSVEPAVNSEAEMARLQGLAMRLIRQVAGDEVAIRFSDTYKTAPVPIAWGGDGVKTAVFGGSYNYVDDLIQVNGIATRGIADTADTALHEAFHRIQYVALGDKEVKILETAFARLKIALGSGHIEVDGAPAFSESMAVAFARYGAAKSLGKDPISELLGASLKTTAPLEKAFAKVATSFDRILDFIEKAFNLLRNGQFDSTRAIFERVWRGDLRNQDRWEQDDSGWQRMVDDEYVLDGPPAWRFSSASGAPLSQSGPGLKPAPARPEKLSLAPAEDPAAPRPTKAAQAKATKQAKTEQARLAQQIEANEAKIRDIEQRAAEEGC